MRGTTHLFIGANAVWLLNALYSALDAPQVALLALLGGFGALLPDLDHPHSLISHLEVKGIRPFAPLGQVLHQALGHRGMLHSFLGLLAFSPGIVLLALKLGGESALVFAMGYLSHLFADALTRSGVPLFFPRRKSLALLPRRWCLTTGSPWEELVFVVSALGVVAFLLETLWGE